MSKYHLFVQFLDPCEVNCLGFAQINGTLFAHVYKALRNIFRRTPFSQKVVSWESKQFLGGIYQEQEILSYQKRIGVCARKWEIPAPLALGRLIRLHWQGFPD